jgi:NTP pyrophosphatase (non-canonical NTP hydrolase)
MNFEEFEREVLRRRPTAMPTAFYALGLAEEAAEVAGEVKKEWREFGETPDNRLSDKRQGKLESEVFDTLFYLIQLRRSTGFNWEELYQKGLDKLDKLVSSGQAGWIR